MNRYLHLHRCCSSLLPLCSSRGGGGGSGRRSRLLPSSSSSSASPSPRFFAASANRGKAEDDQFYLQSLQILERCRSKKVKKLESFVKRSFFGEMDADYLHFPHLVESKEEEALLSAQYAYIRRHFTSICSDRQELISRGLYDTASMTTFELMHLFEAIGASLNYTVMPGPESEGRSSSSSSSQQQQQQLVPIGRQLLVTDAFLTTYRRQKTFVQAVVPLIIHNALVTRALTTTGNAAIRERFLGKSTPSTPPTTSIAFAFCELNDRLAALPYPFWDSTAVYSAEDQSWTLSGSKRRILKSSEDGGYEQYLIFCRTVRPGAEVSAGSTSTSTADNGIATFLVDRSDLQSIESDGTDNLGTAYERITFSGLRLSREEHELYTAAEEEEEEEEESSVTEDNRRQTLATNFALNLKATGQLATAAVISGLLKQAVTGNLMAAYRAGEYNGHHLPLVDQAAFRLHAAAYSLESALYLTAGHFDSLKTDSVDGLHLQAAATKALATELAARSVATLRHLLDPHRQLEPVLSSQTTNVLNVLDGFLDSATSSRMLLGTTGLATVGRWKYDHIAKLRLMAIYFNHLMAFVSLRRFRESKLHRSAAAMADWKALGGKGHQLLLPPELKASGKHLQDSLKEVAEAADQILTISGREAVRNQIDIDRLAGCVLSLFQMVAVLSRTSDTIQREKKEGKTEEGGFSPSELRLCQTICKEEAQKVAAQCQLIFGVLSTSEDKRARSLHRKNLRWGGYFPRPTFDRII